MMTILLQLHLEIACHIGWVSSLGWGTEIFYCSAFNCCSVTQNQQNSNNIYYDIFLKVFHTQYPIVWSVTHKENCLQCWTVMTFKIQKALNQINQIDWINTSDLQRSSLKTFRLSSKKPFLHLKDKRTLMSTF